jgi:hypothetical protein
MKLVKYETLLCKATNSVHCHIIQEGCPGPSTSWATVPE